MQLYYKQLLWMLIVGSRNRVVDKTKVKDLDQSSMTTNQERDIDCLVVSLGRSSIIKYHRSPKVCLNWNETNDKKKV